MVELWGFLTCPGRIIYLETPPIKPGKNDRPLAMIISFIAIIDVCFNIKYTLLSGSLPGPFPEKGTGRNPF